MPLAGTNFQALSGTCKQQMARQTQGIWRLRAPQGAYRQPRHHEQPAITLCGTCTSVLDNIRRRRALAAVGQALLDHATREWSITCEVRIELLLPHVRDVLLAIARNRSETLRRVVEGYWTALTSADST